MLPRLALSVRQPWAHALALGWKDIENRNWRAPNPGLKFRGEIAIHAARGMTVEEYDEAADFMEEIGYECPPPCNLMRGGIIGTCRVVDIVKTSKSPWFFGRIGLVIADAQLVPFIPVSGALGFFEWREGSMDDVPPPAKWMLGRSPDTALPPEKDPQGRLF